MLDHGVEHMVGYALKVLAPRLGGNTETLPLDLHGHGHPQGTGPIQPAETNVADPANANSFELDRRTDLEAANRSRELQDVAEARTVGVVLCAGGVLIELERR